MKKLIAVFVSVLILAFSAAADPDTRCFELRTYHATPGNLEALSAFFRDHAVGFFTKHGMTSLGYWTPMDNTNNVLIYLLAYPDREARQTAWKMLDVDSEWTSARKAAEAKGRLFNKVDSIILAATDFSPAIAPSLADAPRAYELRTYHASPGKLDALLARFRDHTVALFSRHGMDQFGYWVPTEEKGGAGSTLIYILIHRNRDAAKQSFKEFGEDKEWIKVKADSEVDGPLTIKNGVTSLFMSPTDYSPAK
jgi:NIPSNAP